MEIHLYGRRVDHEVLDALVKAPGLFVVGVRFPFCSGDLKEDSNDVEFHQLVTN